MFCVYVYRDPKTGVPVYVGKGLPQRPYTHLVKSSNVRLDRMLKKRAKEGFTITPDVISVESNEDALEMEMLLIAMYGRHDKGTGTLFNLTDGGQGTLGICEHHRLAIVESNRLKNKSQDLSKFAGWNRGVPMSDDAKSKLSASTKGTPKPPGFGEKIRQARLAAGKRIQ